MGFVKLRANEQRVRNISTHEIIQRTCTSERSRCHVYVLFIIICVYLINVDTLIGWKRRKHTVSRESIVPTCVLACGLAPRLSLINHKILILRNAIHSARALAAKCNVMLSSVRVNLIIPLHSPFWKIYYWCIRFKAELALFQTSFSVQMAVQRYVQGTIQGKRVNCRGCVSFDVNLCVRGITF